MTASTNCAATGVCGPLKRLSYLSELQRTGRWQHHFATRDAFEEQLRAADADAAKWKELASAEKLAVEAAE